MWIFKMGFQRTSKDINVDFFKMGFQRTIWVYLNYFSKGYPRIYFLKLLPMLAEWIFLNTFKIISNVDFLLLDP